jgi:hypothetical protein
MVMAMLAPLLSGPLAQVAAKGIDIIGRYIPDPLAAEKAKRELIETLQQSDLAQLEVNKTEASHASVFVAGWRPAIGWVCALVMFTYYVPFALISTIVWGYLSWKTGVIQTRPDIGMTDVIGLLGAMLGIGYLRSYEKVQGVDTKAVAPVARDPKTLAEKIKS